MFDPNRHYPLKKIKWELELVQQAIQDIADDALKQLEQSRKLPLHPLDDFGGSGLYVGMTGVIWALTYLDRVQAIAAGRDFTALLEEQLSANEKESKGMPHPENASYLFGELPILMLQFKFSRERRIADQIFQSIAKNNTQPIRELMWGAAGSMLCATFLRTWTAEDRWQEVFLLQAQRMLREWERIDGIGHLWSPDLYGEKHKYLGPVHGFAGNIIPLIAGRELLPRRGYEDICTKVVETVINTATTTETQANWVAVFDESDRAQTPNLVQHCHGAPGIVTILSKLPRGIDARFDQLLEKGGELTWHAGPLRKGANLCHGTAGNGYAFLKLYERTQKDVWLERARAFAMHAIEQYRLSKELYHQGRYTLWTGDLGLAVYLWDCINGEGNFPTVDVF
jgi:Lanthionine synthetase C-like protein